MQMLPSTTIGQTFFGLVSSMGNVEQNWDTTTASGPSAVALNNVNLPGTTIVTGDNLGVIGDDNATNYGAGGTVVQDAGDVNVGGEQYNIEDSQLTESAFGHSQVHSNDLDIRAYEGSAVALGGGAATGADIDTTIKHAGDVQLANQVGADNEANQLHDESRTTDSSQAFDFDLDFDLREDHSVITNVWDSYVVDHGF